MVQRLAPRRNSEGFTLIELLVVVVILGVLSAVVVFAVRGTSNKGRANAIATEARIIRTAQESYCALKGTYAKTFQELKDARLLSNDPGYHTMTFHADGGPCANTRYDLSSPGIPSNPAGCGATNGWCPAESPASTPYHGTNEGQTNDTMVQLVDGRVFTVYVSSASGPCSGPDCTFNNGSGLFDPVSGNWTTGASVTTQGGRVLSSLVVIKGNPVQCGQRCGQVLVALAGTGSDPNRWKLYDPASNTWNAPLPPPPDPLAGLRGIQLIGPNGTCLKLGHCGEVLTVAGGYSGVQAGGQRTSISRSKFYDPKSNTFSPGPAFGRDGEVYDPVLAPDAGKDGIYDDPLLAPLGDGRILVVARDMQPARNPVAKVYNPDDGTVTDTPAPTFLGYGGPPVNPLIDLPGGKVLLLGWEGGQIYSSAPDPSDASWKNVNFCQAVLNGVHTCNVLAKLPDGRVLAAASSNYDRSESSGPPATYLFTPGDGTWQPTGQPRSVAPTGAGVFIGGTSPSTCGSLCNKVLTAGREGYPSTAPPVAEVYTPPPL